MAGVYAEYPVLRGDVRGQDESVGARIDHQHMSGAPSVTAKVRVMFEDEFSDSQVAMGGFPFQPGRN